MLQTYLHAVDINKGRLPSRREIGQNLDQMTTRSKTGTAVGHGELLRGRRTRGS